MKFKYIGDHPKITQHEVTFYRDEPVDVTGKKLIYRKRVHLPNGQSRMENREILVADKLSGNPDFEKVIEYDGNEIIPKKRGPKVKHGNQARHQEQRTQTT